MREAYGLEVIAILLADLHLTIKPPVWRSVESDWLQVQRRVLLEVSLLQHKYDCPVFCAGDIFDKWNSCPELINLAIEFLPDDMYGIPGQHDLPLHQYDDIHRSAYLTLVKADKIQNILPDCRVVKDNMVIQGFPFGYGITPCSQKDKERLDIAVVHDYVWIPKYSYPDAPREKQLGVFTCTKKDERWKSYDVVVYGDNHKGFQIQFGKTTIFNCGTLMRRKSDEIDYKPQVGLLLKSGEVVPHYLDISQDKYLETMEGEEIESELDIADFIKELEKLGTTALDFKDAINQFLHRGKTSDEAKQIIINAMEKQNG